MLLNDYIKIVKCVSEISNISGGQGTALWSLLCGGPLMAWWIILFKTKLYSPKFFLIY